MLIVLAACGGGLNQQPELEPELSDLAVSHELSSLHGKTVSAPIRVFVNAHSSAREVRFHLNNSSAPTLVNTSSPFDYTLDVANGQYSITAYEVRPNGRVTELGRAAFTVENKAPTVTSFTATPDSVTAGESVTLSWNVADASSIRIDQGVGTVTGTSTAITPTTTTTYTLTATNAIGSRTATTTVTVTQPEPTPPPSEPEPTPPSEPTPPPSEPTPPPSEPEPTPPSEPTPQPPISGVQIKSGDNVSSIISAHPAGTTFVFQAGVHRIGRTITVRNGDTYVGEPGAVISGARLLTSFSREDSYYVATGQTQQGSLHGSCAADSPRCNYPEELFIDSVRLKHVATLAEVRPGTWFFDYVADKIYFADNPSGRVVETSVISTAFSGSASNVTIKNLVVEKFANRAQLGAIHTDDGQNWLVEGNTVQLNHGVGIRVGGGSVIRNNKVLHNGQMGLASFRGVGTLFEGNEVAYNNAAGFNWGWEGGGSKFVRTDGLVLRNNYVHSNYGPGLWSDIDNIRTTYEYNLIENNQNDGIFHEISYAAVIRYNTIRGNGRDCMTGSKYCHNFGAGINIYNSANVEVYGNTLQGNYGGITGRSDSNRIDGGAYGPRELANLYVHNNAVELLYWPNATNSGGGKGVNAYQGVMGGSTAPQFSSAANNRFENNTYYATQSSHWRWAGSGRNFSNWQGYGHDKAGLMTVSSLQPQAVH